MDQNFQMIIFKFLHYADINMTNYSVTFQVFYGKWLLIRLLFLTFQDFYGKWLLIRILFFHLLKRLFSLKRESSVVNRSVMTDFAIITIDCFWFCMSKIWTNIKYLLFSRISNPVTFPCYEFFKNLVRVWTPIHETLSADLFL